METALNKHNVNIKTVNIFYILRNLLSVSINATLFFSCLGFIHYPRGWYFYSLTMLFSFVGNLIIVRFNKDLLKQRSKIREGTKGWDKWWLLTFAIFFMYGMSIVAGIDIRYNGSMDFAPSFIFGIVLYCLSIALSTWSMAINTHFEATVRIQSERGHKVISSGPYQYIRHPGYLAIFFWGFGFPLIIGSTWALLLGLLMIPFVMLRTYFEDKMLQDELQGYKQYAEKTKFRLFPGIW